MAFIPYTLRPVSHICPSSQQSSVPPPRPCVSPPTFGPLSSSSTSFPCKTLFWQEDFSGYPGLPRAFPPLGSHRSVTLNGCSVIPSLSSTCPVPSCSGCWDMETNRLRELIHWGS